MLIASLESSTVGKAAVPTDTPFFCWNCAPQCGTWVCTLKLLPRQIHKTGFWKMFVAFLCIPVIFLALWASRPCDYMPGLPLVGNTFQVLRNPSNVFLSWAQKHCTPVFRIYLGPIPVTVVNCHESIRRFCILHSIALGSRPTLKTFHNVVSAKSGPTIGSTPAGPSFRRKKKCIGYHLSRRSVRHASKSAVFDECSTYILQSLLGDLKADHATLEESFLRYWQCYVLRCALAMTFGFKIETQGADRLLADEVIETENHIINFRSFISNFQDYLPGFCVFPFNLFCKTSAESWGLKRDRYMDLFMSHTLQNLQNPEETIYGSIVAESDPAKRLTSEEAKSVCLTMVSAGLDNLALTVDHIMGHFSYPEYGYAMQNRIYHELMTPNANDPLQAWLNTSKSTDSPYALAVIHEALRYFTVLPLGLPRLTTKSVSIDGHHLQKSEVVIMNNYAGNHDPAMYPNPYSFKPDRWLENGKLVTGSKLNHLAFGLGSRKCSGDVLSVSEMYVLLCRIVLLFEVRKPHDKQMDLDSFRGNSKPKATSFEPKLFYVSLNLRSSLGHDRLHHNINN